MATYFRHLTVNFNLHTGVKQPDMTSKDSDQEMIYLDLGFDIQTPETLEPWLNLLPSLKRIGLHIENDDWVENKAKDNTIQLHILNRSFSHTKDVKKPQCIGFIFSFFREQVTDSITTKYNLK